MTKLEETRRRINEIDEKLAALFEERMACAEDVAAYKKEHGLPVEDLLREKELLARTAAQIRNETYRPYFVQFMEQTVSLSKDYQHRLLDGMRVAYSGTEGAFAQITAGKIFPGAATVAFPDFKSAYSAVEKGVCDCVLLPVENSYNGDVGQVMDLAFFGKLYMNGLYESEISQTLLGVPGARLSDVRRVVSHPQALGQCAPYIEAHGFETQEAVNTALAAKSIAESGRKDLAAIASEEAAALFGLQILEKRINSSGVNTTRFAVFSPAMKQTSPKDERFVLLFTVKNAAGSLGKAVSVIGKYGFNLRALKSRPTKDLVWDYYFYVEGEGSLAGREGEEMLSELAEHCSDLRVLGSFGKEKRV